MANLYATYMSAYDHISRLQWRIFGQDGRKVCGDYGETKESSLDNMEVIKAEVKQSKNGVRYVRVVVKA